MTTPPAPSVINPDIPPPPRPVVSTPSGDRPLSPTSTAGAPNKRTRTVSDDAMNVDITSPPAPSPTLTSTVPSGLPVNKVQLLLSTSQNDDHLPMVMLLLSNPHLLAIMLRPTYATRLTRSKLNSPPIAPCVTKWIVHSPDILPMVPAHAAMAQEITKRSLSSLMINRILPIVSPPHVLIFSI
ncbi:hypothetical protein RhiirA5_368153 [Rhizophagus irregularis]|uniref:Uncharacterized protein n=1 Tax=Rhizophagus irregularis TaxID=588596 RepID=A0A2N0NJM2_9GLOM|nr:hypothetical protein RhiirA5_368153 [Rhizophagus irregularis]